MDTLIYADTIRSADMRHVVPAIIGDPFPYIERDGKRYVFTRPSERERLREAGDFEVIGYPELGLDPAAAELSLEEFLLEILVRACQTVGLREAVVPGRFPLAAAERLRREGIQVDADETLFIERRRVKLEHELAGIRNAQAATARGLEAIREAVHGSGPISSESLREAACEASAGDGVLMEYAIVSHGEQAASLDELGSGEIASGEPIVVDYAVRDIDSGCYSDMTRTFCRGVPPAELVEYQQACLEVQSEVIPLIRPGISGDELHRRADEIIAARGYPTLLTGSEEMTDGFIHGLGHGVGLEIHEAPYVMPGGKELVAGDVITIEPGIYRGGFGGCRLEDLVLVTDDGHELLSEFPYDL